jgi:hypothetical protein
MKIAAKIKAKYLDQILSGEKKVELRQFESITLEDENGRKAEIEIKYITIEGNVFFDEKTRKQYPDVPWKDGLKIHKIYLGKIKSFQGANFK